MTPTIVLVHGAYAESSSWDGLLDRLPTEGRVIAFANPLRSLASDTALLTDLIRTLDGPVVLVGHSYGGAVISGVPADAGDVVALVYIAGFALAPGESAGDASALVPGSTLGDTLVPVPLVGGGTDTYIAQEKYHAQFCADLPADQAARMAITQRPVTQEALFEPAGRAGAVADGPQLVRVRRARPQHPGRRAPDHGRARGRPAHRRDRGRVPRRRHLPRGRGRERGARRAGPHGRGELSPWRRH